MKVSVNIVPPILDVQTKAQIIRENNDIYDGPILIIPGQEEITLETNNKKVLSDIVIEPIPSNYGLVTWNGSYLTIS